MDPAEKIIMMFEDIMEIAKGVVDFDDGYESALSDIKEYIRKIDVLMLDHTIAEYIRRQEEGPADVKALQSRIAVLEKMLAEKERPSPPSYPQVPYPFWERHFGYPWYVTYTTNNTTNMQNKKDKLS